MDAISYSYADKAQKRIKKFIENPDSTSGVLTVPKTIAAGETITIPAGRVAILPDLQVDGDLVVDGDLFIPTGSMTSQVVQKVTSTDNAVVRFNGVTGDVQNSGVIIDDNNNVGIGVINPNSKLDIRFPPFTGQNQTNRILLQSLGSTAYNTLGSKIGITFNGRTTDFTTNTGVGTASIYGVNEDNSQYGRYQGLAFYTSTLDAIETEKMRIDSAGNVGIGVTPSAWNNGANVKVLDTVAGSLDSVGYTLLGVTQNAYYNSAGNWIYKNNGQATRYAQGGIHSWYTTPSGTAGNNITWTNAMTLDSSGNLLVGANTAGSGATSGFNVSYPTNTTVCSIGHTSGTASLTSYMTFSYNGTVIGNIYQSGTTAVTYNTTSDYRLKENIRPSDCKRFMDIKFVDYERIDGRHECGVIAHELQEIYPDLVTGEKDATEIRKVEISPAIEEVKDEDGNVITEAVEATYEEQEFPVYQQVNYMGLIARIGTVVQQQAKLIEAMQLEINELKGAK